MLKLVSTPSSTYRYQVVRADGLPDVELTLFADDQMKALSPSSVPVYLREILSLINWSASDPIVTGNHWSLFGPPDIEAMRRVRAAFDPLGLLNPGKVLPPGPPLPSGATNLRSVPGGEGNPFPCPTSRWQLSPGVPSP